MPNLVFLSCYCFHTKIILTETILNDLYNLGFKPFNIKIFFQTIFF